MGLLEVSSGDENLSISLAPGAMQNDAGIKRGHDSTSPQDLVVNILAGRLALGCTEAVAVVIGVAEPTAVIVA